VIDFINGGESREGDKAVSVRIVGQGGRGRMMAGDNWLGGEERVRGAC